MTRPGKDIAHVDLFSGRFKLFPIPFPHHRTTYAGTNWRLLAKAHRKHMIFKSFRQRRDTLWIARMCEAKHCFSSLIYLQRRSQFEHKRRASIQLLHRDFYDFVPTLAPLPRLCCSSWKTAARVTMAQMASTIAFPADPSTLSSSMLST